MIYLLVYHLSPNYTVIFMRSGPCLSGWSESRTECLGPSRCSDMLLERGKEGTAAILLLLVVAMVAR